MESKLFDTIFTRRSVRRYEMAAFSREELAEIRAFLDAIDQIEGCRARFELVGAGDVTDDKAANYVLAYCSRATAEYVNVGYTLQKLDLYLQARGLGALWLGMAAPRGKYKSADYAIMMAFGKTGVPMRTGEPDFKRLPIAEVSNLDSAAARAARVAPSAVNTQPWKITFAENLVTIDYVGRGLLKAILKKVKSKVDIGIVTRHIVTALQHEGKVISGITVREVGRGFGAEVRFG
jgi:nitroreductase